MGRASNVLHVSRPPEMLLEMGMNMVETKRLKALRGYNILDTESDPEFDAIVAEVAEAFDVPIALMSLVDEKRQWFKSKVGLDVDETPRSMSFCSHAVQSGDTMVVADTLQDERFQANPLVQGDPSIRFYAGALLTTDDGQHIGTICVIDTVAHEDYGDAQKAQLEEYAEKVMDVLETRKQAGTES